MGIAVPATKEIHITVPRTDAGTPIEGVHLWRTRALPDNEILRGGPIRLTARGRTMLDLAGVLESHHHRAAFDSSLHQSLENLDCIWLILEAHPPGKRGAAQLRSLAEEYLQPRKVPASVLESYAIDLWLKTGHRPTVRLRVKDGPRYVAEPDLSWPEILFCAQFDGFGFHNSPALLARDHRQDRELRDLGWDVRRYTYDEVTKQKEMVVVSLAKAMTRRHKELHSAVVEPMGP
jgi:hypothetical protein